MRPSLEVLEDRTLPSVSVSTASPPAAPQVAAVLSYIASTMDQVGHLIGTLEQEEVAFYQALGQEIALAVSSLQQQWYSFLGINPNAANPSQGTAATQPGSGATTAHNSPTQGIAKPRQSGGPQIYFSSAGYTEIENNGTCANNNAILQIDLSAASNNSVSVYYATSDGTAKAGIDYTAVDSSVTFAPGQLYQTIQIPILDDGTDESITPPESFSVVLSNPSGGTLGSPSTATVNIPEAPQQQATDTLQWNPCPGSNDYASDPTNWYDKQLGMNLSKGQPGPGASSPIVFDANPNDTPHSNAPITWDQSFTVASITLKQYTGQMTLPSENILTVKGAINEDVNSSLNVDFVSPGSHLVVQSDTSNLYNFNFSDQQGNFIAEDFAWVNMRADYSESSTANINIFSGATIDLKGDGGGLNLRGDNTEVDVFAGGHLKLEPSGTHSLIKEGNFTTGEIVENQGRVDVICLLGTNTQMSIGVLNDGGQFNVNGGGNDKTQGGIFYIIGFDQRTAYANFDMTGGELNIFNAASLVVSSGYVQSGGSLQTLDTYQEVLSLGSGLALISGGKIVLDTDTTSPEVGGNLFISCQSLTFSGGEYDPKIDGSNVANPNCDLLQIGGSSDGVLKLSGATLNVTVLNPPPVVAVNWVIVKYKSRTGNFNNGTLNGTTPHYGATQVWLTN